MVERRGAGGGSRRSVKSPRPSLCRGLPVEAWRPPHHSRRVMSVARVELMTENGARTVLYWHTPQGPRPESRTACLVPLLKDGITPLGGPDSRRTSPTSGSPETSTPSSG